MNFIKKSSIKYLIIAFTSMVFLFGAAIAAYSLVGVETNAFVKMMGISEGAKIENDLTMTGSFGDHKLGIVSVVFSALGIITTFFALSTKNGSTKNLISLLILLLFSIIVLVVAILGLIEIKNNIISYNNPEGVWEFLTHSGIKVVYK